MTDGDGVVQADTTPRRRGSAGGFLKSPRVNQRKGQAKQIIQPNFDYETTTKQPVQHSPLVAASYPVVQSTAATFTSEQSPSVSDPSIERAVGSPLEEVEHSPISYQDANSIGDESPLKCSSNFVNADILPTRSPDGVLSVPREEEAQQLQLTPYKDNDVIIIEDTTPITEKSKPIKQVEESKSYHKAIRELEEAESLVKLKEQEIETLRNKIMRQDKRLDDQNIMLRKKSKEYDEKVVRLQTDTSEAKKKNLDLEKEIKTAGAKAIRQVIFVFSQCGQN